MIVLREKLSFIGKLMLSMVLTFSIFVPLLAEQAYAASSRAAVVEEVEGTAYLKKAGGSNPYRLFKRMTVNDGDTIITEAKSSVVLKAADRQDEITIGENSEVYIADLLKAEGSETEMKVWSGSIYSKVSELGSSDQYKISTPNATMGVRGTHFFVFVDPANGYAYVVTLSGLVEAGLLGNEDEDDDESIIYPSMQATFIEWIDENGQEITTEMYVTPIIMQEADEGIIERILRNKEEIDRENNEYLDNAGAGLEPLPVDENDLERYQKLLENVTRLIVQQSIENGTLTEEEIQNIIDRVQSNIDWDDEFDPVYSQAEQERMEQLREAERRREEQRQILERRQQQQASERQDLLDQIKQQREMQQQENERVTNDRRESAQQRYLDQLTPEERERFLERRNEQLGETDSDSPPATEPSSDGSRSRTPSSPGSQDPDPQEPEQPAEQPKVELRSVTDTEDGSDVVLEVVLRNFPETLYGAEIHMLLNADHFNVGSIETNADDIFANAADHVKVENGYYAWEADAEPSYTTEIVYTILSVGDVTNDPVHTDGQVLLRVPLVYAVESSDGPGRVILDGLSFVDREGNELSYVIDVPVWDYEF